MQDYVREDHRLEATAERSSMVLARHRWHWTKDTRNDERVSIAEYARKVGRDPGNIGVQVRAYEMMNVDSGLSWTDAYTRARFGAERAQANTAVAQAEGVTESTARVERKAEVDAVLDEARERAEANNTTVADEAPAIAQRRSKARKAAQRRRQEKEAAHSLRYVEVDDHLEKARTHAGQALDLIDSGVQFDDDETALIQDTVRRLAHTVRLLEARMDVDLDGELATLTGGR